MRGTLRLQLTALLLTAVWGRNQTACAIQKGPVLVDFYVFLGTDNEEQVPPRASVNIGGPDSKTGFWPLCRSKCPTWQETDEGVSFPQMRFCPCVAELLVEDLASDFGALRRADDADTGPLFALGEYKEVVVPQELYNVGDGHGVLMALMAASEKSAIHRRPGRLTVWVTNEATLVHGGELAGTTYLDQPLYRDTPGAGVLLLGRNSRQGHRLSHEVGHVVGFHHTAGEGNLSYTYDHRAECTSCKTVTCISQPKPSCEPNIMGSWYDGPYCCPQAPSFLQRFHADQKCLPNSWSAPKLPYCCGDTCMHQCSKEQPMVTFATAEHRESLSEILHCWLRLRDTEAPGVEEHEDGLPEMNGLAATSLLAAKQQLRVQCTDYLGELGRCLPQ